MESDAQELPDSREPPAASVVIPALNVGQTIGAQLEALARQDFDRAWELLIADNGCTDDTLTVVRSFATRLQLRVIDARKRRGINHARNRGTEAARAALVLYCDGDDVVGDLWLRHMVDALSSAEAVGGAIRERIAGTQEVSPPILPRTLTNYDWLPSPIGANCGVQKAWWVKVGGFDESLDRGACDETDFFWRVQLEGASIRGVPAAEVTYSLPAEGLPLARKRYRSGRERARLHRRYRHLGHPHRPLKHAIGHWLHIASMLPQMPFSSEVRSRLLASSAKAAGRIVGSLRYRTFYP
jgi:glycosyltransferase involved in cell wall biosynthesis